jgi:hypothetical protein
MSLMCRWKPRDRSPPSSLGFGGPEEFSGAKTVESIAMFDIWTVEGRCDNLTLGVG